MTGHVHGTVKMSRNDVWKVTKKRNTSILKAVKGLHNTYVSESSKMATLALFCISSTSAIRAADH